MGKTQTWLYLILTTGLGGRCSWPHFTEETDSLQFRGSSKVIQWVNRQAGWDPMLTWCPAHSHAAEMSPPNKSWVED